MPAKPQPKSAQYVQGPDGAEVLFRMRVRWRETGRACMLSHLEVARYLERVVRRADLPYAVSHGFSPHMRIAFGSALPVGVGGTREIFDVFLREQVDPDTALNALSAAAVPDIMPYACAYIDRRAKAASVAFPLSTYRVCFSGPAPSLAYPETITVVRKKKERVLTVGDYVSSAPRLDDASIVFTLESKPEGSLRVDTFVRELFSGSGAKVESITRIALGPDDENRLGA